MELSVPVAGGVPPRVRHWPGVQALAFLLLHGPAAESRPWETVGERLAVRGHPGYAVGLPDGAVGRHDAVAAEVAAAGAALGLSRVLVVAARSWAVSVALRLAGENTEFVAGIALAGVGASVPETPAGPVRRLDHGVEHPERIAGELIHLAGEVPPG